MNSFFSKTPWLAFANPSGACAALNGVFARLTTTTLTTSWATAISHLFHLDESSKIVKLLVRSVFFALNLLSNATMWTLFTRALTLATSTVRVSITNTSANFMLTAALGVPVFGEALPPLWWAGAGLLVAGSVIIGRRGEEGLGKGMNVGVEGVEVEEGRRGGYVDEPDAPLPGVLRWEDDRGETVELEEGKKEWAGDRSLVLNIPAIAL
ncbi:hypothetical protein LTR66_007281 [Elasticomyces elasticus]|nr:hypothetical protein LTR66_007281 [Elasticomyces elasticus]